MIIEAVILGVIQGLTEFFPVSSTAHLILVPWFFGWKGSLDTLTFDIALHAGTLTALLFSFWKDWLELFTKKRNLLGLIIVASIPTGITGYYLGHIAEKSLRQPFLISLMLVAVGLVMLAAERAEKLKALERMNFIDSLIIGIAQAVAIIPGVSRSGITISAGLFRDMKREASARFSFLIATPVIAGAIFLHLKKFLTNPGVYDLQVFATGFISSSVTGFVAITFLLNFLKKYPLNVFVYYRFILAVVIIAGIWLRG